MRKKTIYIIEQGYIADKNFNIRVFINDEIFLTKRKYLSALKQILNSTIGNESGDGYYIECYCAKVELFGCNIEQIKNENYYWDAVKNNLIKEYVCYNK